MRAYSAADEEALLARSRLKDWAGEGLLTESQHQQMEQEANCDLRRTNIFLRLVQFLFTLLIVGAGVGLFFLLFLSSGSQRAPGFFLLVFACLAYVAAELAISRARLYRYGIEEALVLCSVGFLCSGIYLVFFQSSSVSNIAEFLVPAAGALLSLWIWHRLGLDYFFLAAMIFACWLPAYWRPSATALHITLAILFTTALFALVWIRPRHRFTYLDQQYSIAEALLWFGIYLAINLQLSDPTVSGRGLLAAPATSEFSRFFYWSTWVLIWCLPPLVLARGLRLKDRFIIAAGGISAILTLITNRLYVGGVQHSWDPMVLGGFLVGIAILIRRWLAQGANEIRLGFTAKRLSGKDKEWLSTATTAFGVVAPGAIAPTQQSTNPGVQFGGGDSGGGGASSEW